MATTAEVLSTALRLHQSGQLDEAQRLYREVLTADPRSADAWHLLGHVRFARGDLAGAIDHVRRAIEIDGRQPEFYRNLADMLAADGQVLQADACCRQALALKPDFATAHAALAALLARQGKFDEADASCRRAIECQPNLATAHFQLGVMLESRSRLAEAVASYERAAALDPSSAMAQCCLGRGYYGLNEPAKAITSLERAIARDPRLADAHCLLGLALQKLGRLDEAAESYCRAIGVRPDHSEALNNLGTVYRAQCRFAEALERYQKALEARPNFADALTNIGHIYKLQGRASDAAVCYEQSLRIDPRHPMARYSRAEMLLAAGDFERGWPEYETRFACNDFHRRNFAEPVWQGEPLAGRTLLIYAEQALGDIIQFSRYVKLLAARGETVFLEIPWQLRQLFEQSGFQNLVVQGTGLPKFDVQASLMSLPSILGTTLANVPTARQYLAAEPERAERWGRELGNKEKFKIGIVWQGSTTHTGDRLRSFPLAQFAPLALARVELISLQKGTGVEQLTGVNFAVRDFGARLDADGPFLDSAAIIQHLDLVIAPDTAVAHLAAALGARVWLALQLAPDWRWMVERTDSPWYPTMRLFRQTKFGEWPPVMEQMADMLRGELSDRA